MPFCGPCGSKFQTRSGPCSHSASGTFQWHKPSSNPLSWTNQGSSTQGKSTISRFESSPTEKPSRSQAGSTGIPRDSDFLFLIQTILPLSRIHSDQMTTMVDLTGRFAATIISARSLPKVTNTMLQGKASSELENQLDSRRNTPPHTIEHSLIACYRTCWK